MAIYPQAKHVQEDLVVSPLPHWGFSTATLQGPEHRAAAARAALIDVASALRHLHQNGWGHMAPWRKIGVCSEQKYGFTRV
jgi:hypothetical protein